MKKGHPPINFQPDVEVYSIVGWKNISLGFRVRQAETLDLVDIKFFQNWPPEENNFPIEGIFRKDRVEHYRDKILP
jgi:hypothetical protein